MVTVVQERGYVVVSDCPGTAKKVSIHKLKENGKISSKDKEVMIGVEKKRLMPSKLGIESNDYLIRMFPTTMDLSFTVKIEEDLDTIANGEVEWLVPMNKFYDGFKLDHENAKKAVGIEGKKETKRLFGLCPDSEKKIIGTVTKYGPAIQIGGGSSAKFISIPKDKTLDDITPEEVMELVKLPKHIGKDIYLYYGKNGLYLKNQKGNTSQVEPGCYDISLADAESALKETESFKSESHRIGEYELLKGKYGPYIKFKGKNYAIPSNLRSKFPNLSEEHCRTIIANKR